MAKFGELISADGTVLVCFFSQWNEDSKLMQPVINEVAVALRERLRIVKIDAEKNSELIDALRIKSLPTLLIYKDGAMLWRQSATIGANSLITIIKSFS